MTMTIKVLGPGCRNCVILDRVTREAVADLGLDATVAKVEDYQAIMDYSVMTTPALVIDDRVVLAGRVPNPSQLRQLLADAADRPAQTQNTIEGNVP
ncbi:MAG: thioredoxin family protein [Candidatus Nanopelagicales bacterium]|jgi:small redox-active disulfide protein 2|nr:thioredoxin family protein [Candidatus Nanopelagicales bacterium]